MTFNRPPTLDEVAAFAGVSRATVSRVINGVPTVDPALREIVARAIAETGYVPNHAARSLVTRRTDSVALVISEPEHRSFPEPMLERVFTDPFFGRLTAGASDVLRPQGIHVVIMMADGPAHRQVVRYVRQGHVDGVLLISSAAADPLPAQLSDLGVPAVMSTRPAQRLRLSYVDVEQEVGARLAAEHLLARGCRHLATISGPMDIPTSHARLAGFRAALAEQGHARVPSVEGRFTRASGVEATRRLLADHPRTDGIFVANDLMAIGALQTLHELGRAVPRDVAVVGFDDSSAALAARPTLTTIHQPVEEMAAEMARMLLVQLASPGGKPQSVMFSPTLVVRESA